MTISPLAPAAFPDLPIIKGVTFAAAAAGVKYEGRNDVMLAVMDAGSQPLPRGPHPCATVRKNWQSQAMAQPHSW